MKNEKETMGKKFKLRVTLVCTPMAYSCVEVDCEVVSFESCSHIRVKFEMFLKVELLV